MVLNQATQPKLQEPCTSLLLTLGSDGFTKITEKVEKYKENLKNYEKISKRTNIEE